MTTLKKVDVDKEGKMDIALKNLNDYVINILYVFFWFSI